MSPEVYRNGSRLSTTSFFFSPKEYQTMSRHYSFEDTRVGKGSRQFFRVTGTKDRPQRIAYIPAVAYEGHLTPTPEMVRRAKAKDPLAITKLEDIQALRENITTSLRKTPPSAQVWTNAEGKKGVLYPRTEAAKVVWIDNNGYVYWKDSIPENLVPKGVQTVYGFIVLEYELDSYGDPVVLAPDRQIEIGDGHRLSFKYELSLWSMAEAKVRALKEHSKTNPVISTDYLVWLDKQGMFDRTRFSPAGPALWRTDPVVMEKIIDEAAKVYYDMPRLLAKDLPADAMIAALEGRQPADSQRRIGQATTPVQEEVDFASLLGGGSAPVEQAPDFPEIPVDPVFTSLEAGLQQAEQNTAAEAHRRAIENQSL
jgi:hypothetical protein